MPVVDGVVLPDDPARLFLAGKFAHVPLIAGTNADEGTLLGGPPVHNLDQLRKFAQKTFGSETDALLALYPAASDKEAFDAAAHAQADYAFLQGTRFVLRAAAKVNPKTYQYQSTRVNGIGRRLKWGRFHASEIPYVLGTLPDSVYGVIGSMVGDFSVDADTYNDDADRLSKAMSPAWVRFAKTGNPNGPGVTNLAAFCRRQRKLPDFR